MNKFLTVVGGIVIVSIILGGILALFMALPVWLLWNWVCVDALHLPSLTFLQSFGLALLCTILFKNNTSTTSKE
jgi:hypothetical protein